MKHKLLLSILLSTTPLYAGVSAPEVMSAPAPECEQGFTFSLEALYMRAYQSSGDYGSGDWDFGGRASLGYEFGNCLFTKMTYFGYKSDTNEQNDNENEGDDNNERELEVSYIDWVVGKHFKPSEGFTLSPYVGLRYGTLEENRSIDNRDFFDNDNEKFTGFGLLIGIDGTHFLGNNFSIYGTAKTSILFGTRDEVDRFGEGGIFRDEDDIVAFVSELGLGIQYDFTFNNVDANIRLGSEAQWWSGISSNGDENIGLIGFVLGANFQF